MNNSGLNVQLLLGYSGECSSSSCEAGQAKEYMKNILKINQVEQPKEISANRLRELSLQLEKESRRPL